MPIDLSVTGGIVWTTLTGQVTDQELFDHYARLAQEEVPLPWREVVDGRQIGTMAITAAGQQRLSLLVAAHAEQLRGGRVAMVASNDATYGMFRMWELQREGLGYDVAVFRDVGEALEWLRAPSSPPI